MQGDAPLIAIVAGEASGDQHGASLVREIKQLRPECAFSGIGGDLMAGEGVEILHHARDLAVMGFQEILPRLGKIWAAYWGMRRLLRRRGPLALVLIDYPDFNLLLARAAKRRGVPVVYYVSPQVWAWRSSRVETIARVVRKMLVILPFEEAFYRRAGVEAVYVGHPLLDEPPPPSREEARRRFGLTEEAPFVALLPGSRLEEVTRLFPVMLKTARRMADAVPGLHCIVPVASTVDPQILQEMAARRGGFPLPLLILKGRAQEAMAVADLVITASGTATLQAALAERPLVIVYKVAPITYLLGRFLARVPAIGLVNLVAGRRIVPEILQREATPEAIAREGTRLLLDKEAQQGMIADLREVRRRLGEGGASRRAALQVLACLGEGR
jgi:lipid-A-disaccharide synthase